jgi:DNA-directed RNA polymerase specialized sigma subunit
MPDWTSLKKAKIKKYVWDKKFAHHFASMQYSRLPKYAEIELEDLEMVAAEALVKQISRVYDDEMVRKKFYNAEGTDLVIGPLVYKKPGISTPLLSKEDTGLQKIVKGALVDYIRANDKSSTGIGPKLRKKINELKKFIDSYEQKNDRKPDDEEIKKSLKWTKDELKYVRVASNRSRTSSNEGNMMIEQIIQDLQLKSESAIRLFNLDKSLRLEGMGRRFESYSEFSDLIHQIKGVTPDKSSKGVMTELLKTDFFDLLREGLTSSKIDWADRQLIELYLLYELDYKNIASMTGLSSRAISGRIDKVFKNVLTPYIAEKMDLSEV